jgi:hypothetical protein
MKLDTTFANEIKKTGNGDGGRDYRFALEKELGEISTALENRYEFENCMKKYGRAKVALCVAATINAAHASARFENSQMLWAEAVMGLWTNRGDLCKAALINIHPAILADNSRGLRKAVTA